MGLRYFPAVLVVVKKKIIELNAKLTASFHQLGR